MSVRFISVALYTFLVRCILCTCSTASDWLIFEKKHDIVTTEVHEPLSSLFFMAVFAVCALIALHYDRVYCAKQFNAA